MFLLLIQVVNGGWIADNVTSVIGSSIDEEGKGKLGLVKY